MEKDEFLTIQFLSTFVHPYAIQAVHSSFDLWKEIYVYAYVECSLGKEKPKLDETCVIPLRANLGKRKEAACRLHED